MQRISHALVVLTACLLFLPPISLADTGHPVSASQQPIQPGMTIDQHNWQMAEQVLPPEILRLLQAGDFTIAVQETTDFPVRQAYLAATEANSSRVALDGGARITGYQGGLPFPVLDIADPQAGEKAAWNWRYRDMPQTLELRGIMQGVDNAGTIDRFNTGRIRVRTGMYKVGNEKNDLQWQDSGVRLKASFQALEPADQEGNMRIMVIYDDDTLMQEELNYSPQNRRIRKGYANLLARMGGGRYDVLQEEQPPFFFIGYIHNYQWAYKGEQVLLVPGFLQAAHVTYGGKNNWYPTVPWELRQVVVLEATPKNMHPYSKRVFYLDAQTYAPLYVLSYDAQGTCVRLSLIVHGRPDFVPGAQGIHIPVPLGATWINFAQDHASQFVAVKPVFNGPDAPQRFDIMELLRKGK